MAQQTRTQYKQLPGICDIALVPGCDFSMMVNFNEDISTHTYDASIVDYKGAVFLNLTVSGIILTSGTLNLSLDEEETASLPDGCHWYLDRTITDYTRPMLSGKVILKERQDD